MFNKKSSKIVLGLVIFNLMASTALAAAEQQWPNTVTPAPTQITSFAGAHDATHRPFGVLASDDNFVVGVQTNDGAGDLYFYKLMRDGTVGDTIEGWTSPAVISGGAVLIRMVASNDGGAFVAYNDNKVTKINSSGTVSSPVLFDSTATGGCTSPFITGLTEDRFGGVYVSWTCNADQPYVSRLDSNLSVNAAWTGTVGTVKGRLIPSNATGRVSNDGVPIVSVDTNSGDLVVYTTGDYFYDGLGYPSGHQYVSNLTADGALTGFSIPAPNYVTVTDANTTNFESDDAGGAYLISLSAGQHMIKFQHVDSSGNIIANDGADVAAFDNDNYSIYDLKMSEDRGDIFVIWGSDGDEVRVQKLDSTGTVYWGTNGHALSNIYSIPRDPYQFRTPSIIADGTGGAMFTFNNDQSQVVAQRINVDGVEDWGVNGVLLTSDTLGDDYDPVIVHTGQKKEAVILWYGQTVASSDTDEEVFAQYIKTTIGGPVGPGGCVSGGNVVCGSQDLECPTLVNSFGTGTEAPANFQIGDDGSRAIESSNDTSFVAAENASYFNNDNDATYDDTTDEFTFSSNTPLTCAGRTRTVQLTVSASPFTNGSSQNLISFGANGVAGGTGSNADYYAMFSVITSGNTTCTSPCVLAEGAAEANNGIKHGEENFFASATLGDASHAASFDTTSVLVDDQNALNTVTLYNNLDGFEGEISIPGLQYNLAMPANPAYSGSFSSTVTYTLSS